MLKTIDKRTVSSYNNLLVSTQNMPAAVNTTATTARYKPKRHEITTSIC